MTLISGKRTSARSLVVPVLLAFLIIAASAAPLDSAAHIASNGTIDYSGGFSKAYRSEWRGVLVKFLSKYSHDDNLICQTLASYGFNAVYLEVNPFAWTGSMLSHFQDMITACKTYGLELHVLFLYYGYDSSYDTDILPYGLGGSNPDWRMVDASGSYVDWCCLQRASTRARVKQVVETMLTLFPDIVDINHDYVRTPMSGEGIDSYGVCYCSECKAAFQKWLAQNGKTFTGTWSDYYHGSSHWADFAEWRCTPINNIIRDVRQWALAKNPNLIFTADIWSPYAGWTPDYYKDYMAQDPAYWISQGWIDTLNPMRYTNSMSSLITTMDNVIQYHTGGDKGAIPLVPFITQGGSGSGVSAVPINFWVQEIDYLRQRGCNGFIIWRYGGPGFSASGFTDVTPYLAAIRDSCAKGAYPVFKQSRSYAIGSTIIWRTSLPTTGKVEYSQTPIFTATPKTGSLLPYVDIDYVNGTILFEPTPTENHEITVPLSPPFYFRIRDVDSNVELASPVYLNTG